MKFVVTFWKFDGSKHYRYFEDGMKADAYANKIRDHVLAVGVNWIK